MGNGARTATAGPPHLSAGDQSFDHPIPTTEH